MFIVIEIIRALIFGSQTITQETYTSEDHNIKLYHSIKNPIH